MIYTRVRNPNDHVQARVYHRGSIWSIKRSNCLVTARTPEIVVGRQLYYINETF